jgi:hypothetical protein
MRNRTIRAITLLSTLSLIILSTQILAAPANFKVTLDYKSNKKIWGTYNLINEKVQITRGKKKWNKYKKKQLGDLIIKDSYLHFFKANRNKNGVTKILIEKIAYVKNKKIYKSNNKLSKNEFETIFAQGINELIPHKDLINGDVIYSHVKCSRKAKGLLRCTITGKLFAKQKISSNLK